MKTLRQKMRGLLRSRRGEVAIDFIFDAGMKIFLLFSIFAVMIYVMQYYNASYACRRVVRLIETSGEYNESNVQDLVGRLAGGGLENISVDVDAPYLTGSRHIQLREDFTVSLTAEYPLTIAFLGGGPVDVRLPIGVTMAGMSEVFWK